MNRKPKSENLTQRNQNQSAENRQAKTWSQKRIYIKLKKDETHQQGGRPARNPSSESFPFSFLESVSGGLQSFFSPACFLLAFCPGNLVGQTNFISGDDLPPLRPPRAEILPTFWERHQVPILLMVVVLLVSAFVTIWFLTRPKPPIMVPPATKAREALNSLRDQPETGELLSKLSQVLRIYFSAAFNLPQGEVTTTEFSRMILQQESIGRSLAGALVEFLRQCDLRKFSPPPPRPPFEALSAAAKLIDDAESRRAALLPKTASQ